MVDRKHVRKSRSHGYFHRRRPDEIYIQNAQSHMFSYANMEEVMPTPELLFDVDERENATFPRTPDDEASSPRNFFLEKPPASWKSEETPISPGVTVLLSPAYGDENGDLDVMEFFQAATYPGPRAVRITSEKSRDTPMSRNANKKKNSSKIGLPSPKTPKAWPSIVEPDISTLPSPEVIEKNILGARLKLSRREISTEKSVNFGQTQRRMIDNPLEAYLVAPRHMPGRKQTGSPSPEERNTHSQNNLLEPTLAASGTISRTPSPVFDFDDSEITDIESGDEFEETRNERLSRCETLSSQDLHSPMFDKPPKPLEKDWKFRLQQDCAMGTLGALESPSMFSSASQAPRKISKSTNRRLGEIELPNYNTEYSKSHTNGIHTSRPRQTSAESTRSQTSPIIPPPRRNSPPIMAPIHRDQSEAKGASFEPESRTPRTVVSNWLTSMSSNAGRKEQSREHDAFWKKSRSWGRKTKPKLEGWI
ncbi:uncharacterized protein EAE97_000430 [Botrytis byssoidea]|uniref:Uncharacterized protein n=1 Tax=Botrytis byssoidea TaxID=139641 RepID=A0A9P5IVC6_9HELO|nr:uncharacterized protein EAE97_000430 [Botrytis byssoidea]KAF7955171.1 hypothetical protein EAE97_000430 [Botrytis byssoidea]